MTASPAYTLSAAKPQPSGTWPDRSLGSTRALQDCVERLLDRMNIAVIHGGDKTVDGAVINQTGNPRSWKSYKSVAEDIAGALRRLGCPKVSVIPDDMQLGQRLAEEKIHLAWLNTGGVQGYSPLSHAASMLEMMGIPYVGHDPMTAGILDRKDVFKRFLTALGFPTAPFITWNMADGPFDPATNDRFWQVLGEHTGPFIVKPVSGRASLNVHWVENRNGLPAAVAGVYEATKSLVMIEPFLPGREYCVAVSGYVTAQRRELTRHRDPFVVCTIERVFQPEERIVTSMDLRPITNDRLRVLDAKNDAAVLQQLEDLGRSVYREMNIESLIRFDVRADQSGRLQILEANPKPDLKAPSREQTSLVAASLSAYGMSYDDLILSLLADRLDFLFSERPGCVGQLKALVD
ncbi:MAG: hypothetical protein QNI93_19815 [Kiloniellales bacterium]|nr:hypothetical protein [Kiloniellales bacterium]